MLFKNLVEYREKNQNSNENKPEDGSWKLEGKLNYGSDFSDGVQFYGSASELMNQ